MDLPHWWWGKDIAQQSYGKDWKTGSSLITLEKVVPAKQGEVESIEFKADDGEVYKITLADLRKFWKKKLFKGLHHI